MKYYTQDLCDRLNSDDETIRMEADKAGMRMCRNINHSFRKQKSIFPTGLSKVFWHTTASMIM